MADDKLYCVYDARDPDPIVEHAERGGFPADAVNPGPDHHLGRGRPLTCGFALTVTSRPNHPRVASVTS